VTTPVTRREFTELVRKVEDCTRNWGCSLPRIAQIQAELDQSRVAWAKSKHRPGFRVVP
jgi:hypothetical protein